MSGLGNSAWKRALITGVGTFFLAIAISSGSQYLLEQITSFPLGLVLLLIIILTGILFDVVGVAATAADEAPYHSMASRRINGAKHAILLVRNADRVANFCNDVVGDVAGTLSGALGLAIFLRLWQGPWSSEVLVGTLATGVVAAATVGGKSYGKSYAINQSVEIIWRVGLILAWLEKVTGIRLLTPSKKGRR